MHNAESDPVLHVDNYMILFTDQRLPSLDYFLKLFEIEHIRLADSRPYSWLNSCKGHQAN